MELLEKTRKINKLLQRGEKVDITLSHVCCVMLLALTFISLGVRAALKAALFRRFRM